MSEQAIRVRSRHHRQPRERLPHRIWRLYRFEIIWLLVVVAGLFLILEQMNIRESLIDWLRRSASLLLRGATRANAAVGRLFDSATASDILGYVLIFAAIVVIVWRLRWRLMHNPGLTTLCCPKCGGNVHRKHRTALDKLVSLAVPVRRYRCVNSDCHWQGLRVAPSGGASQPAAARGGTIN